MTQKSDYLNNLHERDIHPFLVRYLAKKLNIYSKTIYHEVSAKSSKGKNEWLHPDVVGFNLPVESWNEKVLRLCENFSINRATIYSFELKKIITMETLREQFFQAVSNSSWANEGYLVGVDIDISNTELIQEINRLSSAFGIGVIKLNLTNCEDSEILFPAMRKRVLDGETMNKLFNINSDFSDFVQAAIDSIKINHPVADKFDSVLTKAELKEILDNSTKSKEYIHIQNTKEQFDIKEQNKYMKIDSDFTGKKPNKLLICGEFFEVEGWSDLYIKACRYMIKQNLNLFLEATKKVHGKKRFYFDKNKINMKRPYLFKEIDLYAELNFSANDTMKNIIKLATELKINIEEIKVVIHT